LLATNFPEPEAQNIFFLVLRTKKMRNKQKKVPPKKGKPKKVKRRRGANGRGFTCSVSGTHYGRHVKRRNANDRCRICKSAIGPVEPRAAVACCAHRCPNAFELVAESGVAGRARLDVRAYS
jgi:hypothetical protein